MKAPELIDIVRQAQEDLKDEIADMVNEKLSQVVRVTGLEVTGISLETHEETNLKSLYKDIKLNAVKIHIELPRIISRCRK